MAGMSRKAAPTMNAEQYVKFLSGSFPSVGGGTAMGGPKVGMVRSMMVGGVPPMVAQHAHAQAQAQQAAVARQQMAVANASKAVAAAAAGKGKAGAGSANNRDKKQVFFRTVSRFRDELERTVSNGISRPVSEGLDALLDSGNAAGGAGDSAMGGAGGINEATNELLRNMGIIEGNHSIDLDDSLSRQISHSLLTLNEQAQRLFGNEDAVDDMLASLPPDTADKYIDTFHAVTDMHRHFDNDVTTIDGYKRVDSNTISISTPKGNTVEIKFDCGTGKEFKERRRRRMIALRHYRAKQKKMEESRHNKAVVAFVNPRKRQGESADKKAARKKRNRISAEESRRKQRDKLSTLQTTIEGLTTENSRLRAQVEAGGGVVGPDGVTVNRPPSLMNRPSSPPGEGDNASDANKDKGMGNAALTAEATQLRSRVKELEALLDKNKIAYKGSVAGTAKVGEKRKAAPKSAAAAATTAKKPAAGS